MRSRFKRGLEEKNRPDTPIESVEVQIFGVGSFCLERGEEEESERKKVAKGRSQRSLYTVISSTCRPKNHRRVFGDMRDCEGNSEVTDFAGCSGPCQHAHYGIVDT